MGITSYAPLLAAGGLVLALFIYLLMLRLPVGNEKMKEITTLIHDGAMVYLKRQYKILFIFIIIVTVLLAIFIGGNTAIAYIVGAFLSMRLPVLSA